MRIPHSNLLLPALLVTLTALLAGCGQGRVAAGAVTVIPPAALAPSTTPQPTETSIATATVPTVVSAIADDADADVQAVSALLQRKLPTFPARPLLGPTPNVGGRKATPGASAPVPLLPTPTPQSNLQATKQSQRPRGDGPAGVVNASVVNVRGGPGTEYAVAGKVRQGDSLSIVGRNDDGTWLKICCLADGEEQTWIAADFVDIAPSDDLMARIPLAEAPPTPVAAARAAAVAPAPGAGAGIGLPGPGNFPAPGATNPLTGLPLPGGRSGQRPIIVCINNDFAARPQLGTSQADVMYEYLMEGYGITRFSGIYYGQSSNQIGPVRSARLINYYMGALYDAGLVCSGASDRVRYLLKHEAPFPYMDIDLDDPSNARYSTSIGSDYRTRLRTGTDKLRQWLADWGVEKPASIRGFTFGAAPGGGVPATSIGIAYPNGQAAFRYDAGGGRYLRSMSGGAHVDGNTGAQLAIENVIVQYVPHQATDIVEDSLGSTSIRLDLFGSGQAIVFRDGQAFEGTWRSESRGDTPRFFDASGAEIPLKPGKTWISVAPDGYGVTYQ